MNETAFIGGQVHVLGGHAPVEALLVRDGRVTAIGSRAEVEAAASAGARVEHLHGATATPGLVDAHVHLTAWALNRRRIELGDAATMDDALQRVRTAATARDAAWLQGQGWNANRWGRQPTAAMLDAVVPDRPVVLESQDLHAFWLNSEALRRCGITAHTADPSGGTVVRDVATGEPTGVLLENAKQLAARHLPLPEPDEVQAALCDAQGQLHRWGITGVHSVEPSGLADFEALRQDDHLQLRVLQHMPLDHLDAAIAVGLRSGFGGDWLRIGGVKMFLDGALGSRTAWLREPYEEDAGNRGLQTLAEAEFRDVVRRAAEAGIAAAVHAIGDAAVGLALDVLGSVPPPAALPHRIEHLQLCPPEWWARAARSGIVASMQPVHLRTDVPAAERHWGHERSRGAYAFAPLLHAGMTLAFGSDVPVETADPREGLYAACRRRDWTDEPADGWFPEHRLTAAEALHGYTEGPARAEGLAERRGRLLPGYDADLAVWDRDPLHCPPEQLREMRCLLTVVGGEVVHRDEPST